ncbi:MAG: RDD family protein [Candidatus Eutrophobiaceae bacterium]
MLNVLETCSLPRRLGVILYDLLLLFSIMFLFTAFVIIFGSRAAIESENWIYKGFLLGICCLYYTWHWTHGRETLGMRAWRVAIQDNAGRPPSYPQALLRFALSTALCLPLGLGLFWMVFDREHLSLYDRLSGTRLMH